MMQSEVWDVMADLTWTAFGKPMFRDAWMQVTLKRIIGGLKAEHDNEDRSHR